MGVKAARNPRVAQVGIGLAELRGGLAEPAFAVVAGDLVVRIAIVVPEEALVALIGMIQRRGGSREEVILLGAMLRGASVRQCHREIQQMVITGSSLGQHEGLFHADTLGGGAFKAHRTITLLQHLVSDDIGAGRLATDGTDGFDGMLVERDVVRRAQNGTGDPAALGAQLIADRGGLECVLLLGGRRNCGSDLGGGFGRLGRGCGGFLGSLGLLFGLLGGPLGGDELLILLHVIKIHPHEENAGDDDDPAFAIHEIKRRGE